MEWLSNMKGMEWFVALIVGVAGIAIGAFFGKKLNKSTKSDSFEEKINTLKEACHLSKDALMIINRSKEIVFANPSMRKLCDIRIMEPIKTMEETLKFCRKGEDRWLNLENLLQLHRQHGGMEKTVFREMEVEGEKRQTSTVEIQTYRSEQTHQFYDIVVIHDQNCEKKLFDLHHLNTLSGLPNQYKASHQQF